MDLYQFLQAEEARIEAAIWSVLTEATLSGDWRSEQVQS